MTLLGGTPGTTAPAGAPTPARPRRRDRSGRLWKLLTLPGLVWLAAFFVLPLYLVLAIVFGRLDPLFRTPVPVWNPLQWDATLFVDVLGETFTPGGLFGAALVRTIVYVLVASMLCVVIAFPIAYYVARLAGRRRGLLLALLIAPFWISYMMRMLAWVNLLAHDGLVNRIISLNGLLDVRPNWLSGNALVVVLGLAYGYVPYMILPLYAGLDRLPQPVLEAARDLGATRASTFWRVTLPMCRPTIVAGVLLTCLPMLGDYFTNDLLSASPSTSMVGNLINTTVLTPGQTGAAGAYVTIVFVIALVPMIYYLRSVSREDVARS
jgi:ABC-type spermidine/putrescine transport system permease subunit I